MKNRLLLELDSLRKEINREVIHARIPSQLSLEDFAPIIRKVAEVRADYMATLLAFPEAVAQQTPDLQAIEQLKEKRLVYEELVAAVNALETVIQREYLDVRSDRKLPHAEN